jgi:hypothetical protein
MKINDTLLMFWKLDARCFLCSPDIEVASDNTQCLTVDDCLNKHNLANICALMVFISVDSLWKYEYGSDLAIFPALAIFPSRTLYKTVILNCILGNTRVLQVAIKNRLLWELEHLWYRQIRRFRKQNLFSESPHKSDQTSRASGQTRASYLGGLGFKSRPGDRLSWLKIFAVSLSPSRQIP